MKSGHGLKENEVLDDIYEQIKFFFDGLDEGVVVVDMKEKRFVRANHAFCRMVDYTPKKISRIFLKDIHPHQVLFQVKKIFDKIVWQGKTFVQNVQVRRKDGTIFNANVNSVVVNIKGETFAVAVFSNNTGRRETLQPLANSEEKYNMLFNYLSNAVFMCTFNNAGKALATDSLDMVNENERSIVMNCPQSNLCGKKDVPGSYYLVSNCKDGTEFVADININLIKYLNKPA